MRSKLSFDSQVTGEYRKKSNPQPSRSCMQPPLQARQSGVQVKPPVTYPILSPVSLSPSERQRGAEHGSVVEFCVVLPRLDEVSLQWSSPSCKFSENLGEGFNDGGR